MNTFILSSIGNKDIIFNAKNENDAWKILSDAGIRNQSGILKLGVL